MKRYNQDINGEGSASTNLEGLLKAEDLAGSKSTNVTPTQADIDAAKKVDDDKNAADKLAADKAAADAAAKEEADKNKNSGTDDTKPEAVELDGVKYKLNPTGDAVNEKGEVVKTKAELDALESSQEDEIPIVDEYLQKVGIEVLDENGKPKKFEDSVEGLIEANKAVAKIQATKEFDGLLNSDPRFKKYFDYLRMGGDEKEYFAQRANSWADVKFDENNEAMAINAVVQNLVNRGINKQEAELTAQMYKETNKLKEFGKGAYTSLVDAEKTADAKREQDFIANQKREQEEIVNHWTNIKSVIDKGTINNITIPDSEREAFYKWQALAVKDGLSQAQLDAGTMPIEQSLLLEYLRFKKFDFSNLIKAGVGTERVKSLRTRLAREQKGAGEGEGPDKGKITKPTDFPLSLESVITGTTRKETK